MKRKLFFLAFFLILVTYGQANKCNEELDLIADVFDGTLGETFTVKGIVTTTEFGSSEEILFFIQDESAGILINYSDNECSTTQGDEVLIVGVKAEIEGMMQIVATSLETVSENNELPEYESITVNDLNQSNLLIGSRVSITDVILQEYQRWPIERVDSTSSVPASIDTIDFSLRIDDGSYYNGTSAPCGKFSVSGILTNFSDNRQIMPFFDEELISTSAPEASIDKEQIIFEMTDIGSESFQSFSISGHELYHDVVIEVTGDFMVSIDSINYSNSLILLPNAGIVDSKSIFMKFAPSSEGVKVETLSIKTCGIEILRAVFGQGFFGPEIFTNTELISFPSIEVGSSSESEILSFSGSYFQDSLFIQSTGDFTFSLDSNTSFEKEIALPSTDGEIDTTTLFVKFSPTSQGNQEGKITFISDDLVTKIDLTGSGFDPTKPSILTSESALLFDSVEINSSSLNSYFILEGRDLSEDILLSVNGDFEISTDQTVYSDTLSLPILSGILDSTQVFVRFSPKVLGETTGQVTVSSGEIFVSVALTGLAIEPSEPTIIVSNESLEFNDVVLGAFSQTKAISITANDLFEDVLIRSSESFEISLGGTKFSNFVTIPVDDGSVLDSTIDVIFKPNQTGTISGTIQLESSGKEVVITTSGVGIEQGTPSISFSKDSIIFNEVQIDLISEPQSFLVGANNLSQALLIESRSDFEISLGESVGFGSQLELDPNQGDIQSTNIFVRVTPNILGLISGYIYLTSEQTRDSIYVEVIGVDHLVPDILVSPTSVSFPETVIGSISDAQPISLEALNLSQDLIITIDNEDFQISFNDSANYVDSLIVTQSSGQVPPINFYVRFSPSSIGQKQATISVSSSGISKTIEVTGDALEPLNPTIIVSTDSITFGEINFEEEITPASFFVEANNLEDDIRITTSEEFSVSSAQNGNFSDLIVLPAQDGVVSLTQVFVKINADSSGEKVGQVSLSSTGAEAFVNLIGNIIAPEPFFELSTENISFELTNVSEISNSKSFTMEAEFLTEDIQITSSEEFEISLNEEDSFTNTIAILAEEGRVPLTTVFVRFVPISSGEKLGSILLSSSASSRSISLSAAALEKERPLSVNSPSIKIFPNPALNYVTISGLQNISTEIKITDLMGTTILDEITVEDFHLDLNRYEINSGIYFVEIIQGGNQYNLRLIVQ